MKKQTLLIAAILVLTSIVLFAFVQKADRRGNSANQDYELTVLKGTKKEKAIEFLKVQVLDTDLQTDGKVGIVYTNLSEDFIFSISKTGLKYKSGKKIKYLVRRTPVVIRPNETVELEISIPFLIRPKVAYALKDDIVVRK